MKILSQNNRAWAGAPASRRGSIAVAVVMILFLAALSGALVTLTSAGYLEHRQSRDEMRAFYVAEAGVNQAFAILREHGRDGVDAVAYPQDYGSGSYDVAAAYGADDPVLRRDRVRLSSTGDDGRETHRVVLMVRGLPNGFFRHAIFGDEGVALRSESTVDSFDSTKGPYPEKVEYAGTFGNVGSNNDISMAANINIWGDVNPGPDGVVEDSAPNTMVYGSTEPADTLVDMPPITVPSLPSLGLLNVVAPLNLPTGKYHFDALSVKGNLTITGPAVIVVADLELLAGATLKIDATLGPVEIYGTGSFDLRSNSIIHTESSRARDISVFLTGDTRDPRTTIALNSNSDFYGTIYAPNADVSIESNFRLHGAIKARRVALRSNAQVHFDEDLLFDDDKKIEYERVSWQSFASAP